MTQQNTPRSADDILQQLQNELREKQKAVPNASAVSDDTISAQQNEDAVSALKWAVSRPMDEKGYTGAYERYHTNHGVTGSRLSEEKKQEIRDRVSKTLAEGILASGMTGTFVKAEKETQEEITVEAPAAEQEIAAQAAEDFAPIEETAPIPPQEENEMAAPVEEPSAEVEEKRGILTDEGGNAVPFSYTDFKLKRANAVKEFFNNMHEFTFTRTNQEAVEMLHMHQQSGTSFAEAAELEEESDEIRKKKEQEIYKERVENLRHILSGEKLMTWIRMLLTGIFTVCAGLFLGVSSSQNAVSWFGADAPGWVIALLQLLILICGGLVSINVYMGALQLIKNRRFGKELLVAVIYTAGLLMGIVTMFVPSIFIKEYYTSYAALYLLTAFGYHLGMHLQMRRLLGQFEKLAADKTAWKYSLEPLDNRFLLQNLDPHRKDGGLVLKQVKADVIAGFEDHCFAPDWFDKLTKPFLIGLTALAFLTALGTGILSGDFLKAIYVFFGTFGFCSPFAAMYAAELPMQRTVKETAAVFDQYTVLHADAVEEMADASAVIVASDAIFPPESVILHGLRSAAGVRVDEAILDAVSILTAGKSVLAPTFLQMISDKTELLKPVDSITYEDGMGISAWVDNNRVLIGSRRMMENHNIRMPSQDIEQAEADKGRMILYLAKQGELITAFSLTLHLIPQAKRLLEAARNQSGRIYVRSVDCLIENHLLSLFGEDADIIGILPSRLHADYEKETNRSDAAKSLVISDGSLSASLHASMQLQRLRASLEIIRLLVVVLTAVTGIFFAAACMAGTPAMIGAVAALIPVLLHAAFFLLKR